MIQSLNNISIFRRLFVSFAFAAAIPAIVIILLGNFYLSNLTMRGQAVQVSVDAQNIASTQQNNLSRMNALLQTRHDEVFAALSNQIHDPSLIAAGGLITSDIASREADFNFTISSYDSSYEIAASSGMSNVRNILLNDNPATGPEIISDQKQALDAVTGSNGLWMAYKQLQDVELVQLQSLEANPPTTPADLNNMYGQAYLTLWKANRAFTDLNNTWQRVVDDAVSMSKTVTSVGTNVQMPVIVATSVAVILSVVVIFLTGGLANLTIAFPLRRLASLTRDISRGDTNARAPVIGRDEIALVASSMNSMLDNIVQLVQRTQAEKDNLQTQVEKLVSEVSGAGEGDLRIQAEVTASALGVLADSFNYMVEELSSLVIRVKRVAYEVERSTLETFDRMEQLVGSTDTQVDQIGQAAVEVERMAASSRQVAERAERLFKVAREARQTAQGGRDAVQQTVRGIERIYENVKQTAGRVQVLGDRSQEINNIVDVMSNIAHQTNRLALDASIQAAMAGVNGKGFLAVAEDIRRLAERSKEQTRQITQIIRSVREDIGSVAVSMNDTQRETLAGSELARIVDTSLSSIFSGVEHQAEEIDDINQMAMQQLRSSHAVAQIIQTVTSATRQTGSSAHTMSQNMERLARLAEQLRASVEAFKVNEDGLWDASMDSVGAFNASQLNDAWSLSSEFRTVTGSAELARSLPQPVSQTPVGVNAPYQFVSSSGQVAPTQGAWNDMSYSLPLQEAQSRSATQPPVTPRNR